MKMIEDPEMLNPGGNSKPRKSTFMKPASKQELEKLHKQENEKHHRRSSSVATKQPLNSPGWEDFEFEDEEQV